MNLFKQILPVMKCFTANTWNTCNSFKIKSVPESSVMLQRAYPTCIRMLYSKTFGYVTNDESKEIFLVELIFPLESSTGAEASKRSNLYIKMLK